MKKLKTPAEFVIDTFGGIRATGRALERDPKTIHTWKTKVNQYGERGRVPEYMHKKIIAEAKKRGLKITLGHLLIGG